MASLFYSSRRPTKFHRNLTEELTPNLERREDKATSLKLKPAPNLHEMQT
jgi:hypothetical protein